MQRLDDEALNRDILRRTVADIRARNEGMDAASVAKLIDTELGAVRQRTKSQRQHIMSVNVEKSSP